MIIKKKKGRMKMKIFKSLKKKKTNKYGGPPSGQRVYNGAELILNLGFRRQYK